MTKDRPAFDGRRRAGKPAGRAHRPWLWGLAGWLRNGGIAVAFYAAWQAGPTGAWALAAFVGGFFLGQVLEATSQGD